MKVNQPAQHQPEEAPRSELVTPNGDFDDMVAAASRRLGAAANEDNPTASETDPDAVNRLSPAANPMSRYFANRDARADTLEGYRTRLRAVRKYLIEAGMDSRFADVELQNFPWHVVTPSVAARFWEILSVRYTSHKSRENLLGALRRMLDECAAVGLITLTRRDALRECLPIRSGPQSKPGRALDMDELQRLISAPAKRGTRIGLRDAAIIATFASTGVRLSELADIDITDVDISSRQVWIRRTKGGRSHQVWLHEAALTHVIRWMAARGEYPGPLFKSTSTPGSSLSVDAIRRVIIKVSKEAGVAHLTSHDFRRTFITLCLREGVDVFALARLVGHKRVSTTLQYDRRSDAEDQAIVDSLPFASLRPGAES
jgi:integrase